MACGSNVMVRGLDPYSCQTGTTDLNSLPTAGHSGLEVGFLRPEAFTN